MNLAADMQRVDAQRAKLEQARAAAEQRRADATRELAGGMAQLDEERARLEQARLDAEKARDDYRQKAAETAAAAVRTAMHVAQNVLNGGEISPQMAARMDQPRYQTGCELLENMVPLPRSPLIIGSSQRCSAARAICAFSRAPQ